LTFIDVDGRRLSLRVAGAGDVTVVFESGLGMSGVCWGLVEPRVAARARTVVYDRAGLGGSDVDSSPRTLERLADDLGAVLSGSSSAGVPAPSSLDRTFVLVGHSWGGPIVRLLAARDIAARRAAEAGGVRVRAVVLVDPSDERDDAFFTKATARRMAVAGPLTRAMAGTGIYRAAARIGRALPDELYARFRDENFGRRAARALHAEIRHFLPGLAALRANPPDLGDLPVTIISSGARSGQGASHAASAKALANGRLVVAPDAGHNIMFDDPDLVTAEILRLL
jgi:pimeloyl-ACP methyl ester carboxylesterase